MHPHSANKTTQRDRSETPPSPASGSYCPPHRSRQRKNVSGHHLETQSIGTNSYSLTSSVHHKQQSHKRRFTTYENKKIKKHGTEKKSRDGHIFTYQGRTVILEKNTSHAITAYNTNLTGNWYSMNDDDDSNEAQCYHYFISGSSMPFPPEPNQDSSELDQDIFRPLRHEFVILGTNSEDPSELWVGGGDSDREQLERFLNNNEAENNEKPLVHITLSRLFSSQDSPNNNNNNSNEKPIIRYLTGELIFSQDGSKINEIQLIEPSKNSQKERWCFQNTGISFDAPLFWRVHSAYIQEQNSNSSKMDNRNTTSNSSLSPCGNGITGVWRKSWHNTKFLSVHQELSPDLIFSFHISNNQDAKHHCQWNGFWVYWGMSRKLMPLDSSHHENARRVDGTQPRDESKGNHQLLVSRLGKAPFNYDKRSQRFILYDGGVQSSRINISFHVIRPQSFKEKESNLVITETKVDKGQQCLCSPSPHEFQVDSNSNSNSIDLNRQFIPWCYNDAQQEERKRSFQRRISYGDLKEIKEMLHDQKELATSPSLFARGSDEENIRYTPLQIAVTRLEQFEVTRAIIEELLRYGAQPEDPGGHAQGTTLFHILVLSVVEKSKRLFNKSQVETMRKLAQYLKELGIDSKQENQYGQTPFSLVGKLKDKQDADSIRRILKQTSN